MKNIHKKNQGMLLILVGSLLSFLLFSCKDVVSVNVQSSGVTQLSVDAFLNNKRDTVQVIKLSLTQNYFDNATPTPATGASVYVYDEDSTKYVFTDVNNNGTYSWTPAKSGAFGTIGKKYTLYIKYNGEAYTASSKMNRVPPIDSITYTYKTDKKTTSSAAKTTYRAQFYAKDYVGVGDCYWIKSAANNSYLTQVKDLNISFDAGYANSGLDGLVFIQPIRNGILGNKTVDSGTNVRVEIHSINYDTYKFLNDVIQVNQNGGIFAKPLGNLPTNISNINTSSTKTALGFFNVAAVRTLSTVIDASKAKPE